MSRTSPLDNAIISISGSDPEFPIFAGLAGVGIGAICPYETVQGAPRIYDQEDDE
jgi:hypothetical protein